MPYGIWDKRGAAVGILAVVVSAAMCLGGAFHHSAAIAWSRRHVVLDALLIVPLTFFGLAYITGLSLVLCAAIALGAGAVLVPIAVVRRGSAPA